MAVKGLAAQTHTCVTVFFIGLSDDAIINRPLNVLLLLRTHLDLETR